MEAEEKDKSALRLRSGKGKTPKIIPSTSDVSVRMMNDELLILERI